MNRRGDFIETFTGIQFWPLDPRPEDIEIQDIAAGLSKICRFNGQCRQFYSVAQHSVNSVLYAARLKLSARMLLLVMLHDAAEAYVSDVAAPIKPLLPEFAAIEDGIMDAVYKHFEIEPPTDEETRTIKHIDKVMLMAEARRLMPMKCWGDWVEATEPFESACFEAFLPADVAECFIEALGLLLKTEKARKAEQINT